MNISLSSAPAQQVLPGRFRSGYERSLQKQRDSGAVARFWKKDPSVFKLDAGHQKVVKNRLGWQDAPARMQTDWASLETFARDVSHSGIEHGVLLGMGGSSLAPEVFAEIFGSRAGRPALHILDSTDPAFVRRIEQQCPLAKTLFVVASKSGGTIETLSQMEYFWALAKASLKTGAGRHFVAITDPKSALEETARKRKFRRVFLNSPDIGGRYSALSLFGLVPAALIGAPVSEILDSALVMRELCERKDLEENPGWTLGTLMAQAALAGANKLTFLATETLKPFVPWLEQLIAESTGKEGQGVVPVEAEEVLRLNAYGATRIFVALRLEGEEDPHVDDLIGQAQAREDAVVEISLPEKSRIGAEMMRWEVATSVAGLVLGINPYDEPNVSESKAVTTKILKTMTGAGQTAAPRARVSGQGLKLFADDANWELIKEEAVRQGRKAPKDLAAALGGFLGQVRSGDYIALLSYTDRIPQYEKSLARMRRRMTERLAVASLRGYGPRYLHSIGQLYKGGPNTGVFMILTADPSEKIPVPGKKYSFGELEMAQALGDLSALEGHERRVIRIHLGKNISAGLKQLEEIISGLQ
ncbi:MAG: glucose-6-phosphate isomerase [Candidatus Omnitrophica bacterium]|nr:glucose-6-phosphate isomerase [Candidatus Omnitrophota bacterium]